MAQVDGDGKAHWTSKDDRGLDAGHPATSIGAGELIDILSARHRVLAIVSRRVLAVDVRGHVPFLIQDADGSIQLPRIDEIEIMLDEGQASLVRDEDVAASPTDGIACAIDMLEAAGVAQGDKAIWLYLSTNWTDAHLARYGPFEQPWKIRRWRAALRRSRRERDRLRDAPSNR